VIIIVNSSAKYFVTLQQWKCNPLLAFDSDTENFYMVDRYICDTNNKEETYCCVSMATTFTRTRRNLTLYVHFLSCYKLKSFRLHAICMCCNILFAIFAASEPYSFKKSYFALVIGKRWKLLTVVTLYCGWSETWVTTAKPKTAARPSGDISGF
jgi:hypothetical protein